MPKPAERDTVQSRILLLRPNHGKLWKSLMRAHLGDDETLERALNRNKAHDARRDDTCS